VASDATLRAMDRPRLASSSHFARTLGHARGAASVAALVLSTAAPSGTARAQPRTQPAATPAAPPRQDLIARGRQLFDDQQYEESIQTLSAALLRPNNSGEQRVEIYRLLALNYITLNRREEAESAVRGLLALEPGYALPASESPRFRDFFAAARERWEADGRPGVVKPSEPPPAPVTMAHASPPSADPRTPIALSARLGDPDRRVAAVKLFFRSGSRGKFEQQGADLTGGAARATIPASAVRPPLVEYYLQGFDAGGLPIVSRGDAGAPLRVAVPEPSKGWVLPAAIGGGVLGAAAIVGGLALAGVFKGSSPPPSSGGPRQGTVSVTVSE